MTPSPIVFLVPTQSDLRIFLLDSRADAQGHGTTKGLRDSLGGQSLTQAILASSSDC